MAGAITAYAYDVLGRLARVTQADGSSLAYSYDAAGRLLAVQDHLGNRVEYTLDAAGNRVAEQVRDPAGGLRRQLARSFDALGRMTSLSGRP